MKNAKRWLAILLAVILLCSNGVSQLGMIVSASELETTEEAQPKEDAVVEQAEETKEDTGKATVEGVTPEEERGESSAQDAEQPMSQRRQHRRDRTKQMYRKRLRQR